MAHRNESWHIEMSHGTNERPHFYKQETSFRPIIYCNTLQLTATHCNTLQHTATHCITLQHTATHCNTLHMNGSLKCSMTHFYVLWLREVRTMRSNTRDQVFHDSFLCSMTHFYVLWLREVRTMRSNIKDQISVSQMSEFLKCLTNFSQISH